MFGFKKHCVICGEDVKKEEAIKRFDKYMCSEEHAEEYRQKMAKEQSQPPRRGGCCG